MINFYGALIITFFLINSFNGEVVKSRVGIIFATLCFRLVLSNIHDFVTVVTNYDAIPCHGLSQQVEDDYLDLSRLSWFLSLFECVVSFCLDTWWRSSCCCKCWSKNQYTSVEHLLFKKLYLRTFHNYMDVYLAIWSLI